MRETLSSEISPHTIATAQWWQDRVSAFEGLDKSLYLEEIIEELGGIEQRRYLSIDGGTDLSRAEFENWATETGLVLNPPPDVEPFQHFCYKLRKDQQENNPDYRPGGLETRAIKSVGISEEIKKEHQADFVKWNKARREAEDFCDNVNRNQLGVVNKDTSIDSRTVAQVVFDKAVEIATKNGVSSRVILAVKRDKYVGTRTSCIIPKVAEAAAAFCSRLATEARKLERPQVREETSTANRGNGTVHLQGQEKNKPKHLLMPTKATPEERAQTVAQVIAELNTLKPQMYGEQFYEELRDGNGDFLSFQIAEQRNDLKLKLVNIQRSTRHIRLAQELAAHYHGIVFETMKSDWKHHKPENFPGEKYRKTSRKKRKNKA